MRAGDTTLPDLARVRHRRDARDRPPVGNAYFGAVALTHGDLLA